MSYEQKIRSSHIRSIGLPEHAHTRTHSHDKGEKKTQQTYTQKVVKYAVVKTAQDVRHHTAGTMKDRLVQQTG